MWVAFKAEILNEITQVENIARGEMDNDQVSWGLNRRSGREKVASR